MTALVSAFSRAYHSENNNLKIFNDSIAKKLFSEQEYTQIGKSMAQGILFFNPSFTGNDDEALRWIVDNQLSPSPLGRAAYTERMLENAVSIGAKQYLIFAAGYDTFAYRQPEWVKKLTIFEIDHPLTVIDKQKRLRKACLQLPDNVIYVNADFTDETWDSTLRKQRAFDRDKISFCSLLGLSYYLSTETLKKLLAAIARNIPTGSLLVFDYPDQDTYTANAGKRAQKQVMLASATKETMLGSYSTDAMDSLLSNCGFLLYEHLMPNDITMQYFKDYNIANPLQPITAFDNVNYCLAVRR